MPLITLQNRLFIDNQNTDKDFLLLIQHSYNHIMTGVPYRIWTNAKLKSWDELKAYKPDVVKATNEVITEYTNAFLHPYRRLIKDMSCRNFIAIEKLEAEVYETDITNIDGHKLAVYFISKQHKLIRNFGLYILIAEIEDTQNTNTFMIELSNDLTIKSYTE
jgi:hypothetical protein